MEPLPSEPQSVGDLTEIQKPITNDFTLIKACIGKPQEETVALLSDYGFTAIGDNKFSKTENTSFINGHRRRVRHRGLYTRRGSPALP